MDYQRKLATRRCLFLRPPHFAFVFADGSGAFEFIKRTTDEAFSTDTRGNRSRYIRLHRGPTYTLGHRRFAG